MSPEMKKLLVELSVVVRQMYAWRPIRDKYPVLFEGAVKQAKEIRARIDKCNRSEKRTTSFEAA